MEEVGQPQARHSQSLDIPSKPALPCDIVPGTAATPGRQCSQGNCLIPLAGSKVHNRTRVQERRMLQADKARHPLEQKKEQSTAIHMTPAGAGTVAQRVKAPACSAGVPHGLRFKSWLPHS